MPIKPVISAHELVFVRNGVTIIDDFSFEIQKGQLVGIIGPNGAGKSTLMKLMMGLLEPTAGNVKLLGENPRKAAARKQIAYVAQRGGNIDPLFPATVIEVVQSGLRTKKNVEKKTKKVFKDLDIEYLAHRHLSQLSGGERQRALIARALIAEPKILFLDEPTDGLDPESRKDFYNLLETLKAKKKLTIIIVSHDVHTITSKVDAALCLKHDQVCHGNNECVLNAHQLHNVFHKGEDNIHTHH
ncbi:MAG: ATP-binding cassette domain-containing protein [bacterium]|jgi:zinc transport system ATP-binding protein|nr:ATP-binding cassette domain-containing protein [bacterium]